MLIGFLTALTLIAFAANSLLCRMALGGDLIDPVSFTTLRLVSGVLILVPLSARLANSGETPWQAGSWSSSLALFVYALAFSLSYLSLSTGMGALILFGSVQVTMIAAGLRSGERLHPVQWLGLLVALGGLGYLVSPGIRAPHPMGALAMLLAGIAWGVYSLRGRKATNPMSSTAGNFLLTVPMAALASLVGVGWFHVDPAGIVLAVISGALTSGLGYVLWYRALRELTATRAAVVQLLVPVLAAFGGILFLAEQMSWRLIFSTLLILGGVAAAIVLPPSSLSPSVAKSLD